MSIKQKLTKKLTRTEQLKQVVPDIEDSLDGSAASKSQFFSPVQTRKQRKANGNPLKTLELPHRNVNSKENNNLKTTRILEPALEEPPEKLAKWEPKNWKKMLDNIQKMRSMLDAPVDTMGCDKCSDETTDEKTQRYHKLVALMLSSQTKDQVTFHVMNRLKENGLTPEKIVNFDQAKLEELLKPVSFYKTKAKNIKRTAEILVDKYSSDIPGNIDEILKLPGVGPKMGHICMNTAWDVVTGIGVDVHVHRIANRIGWVRKQTKEPEQTRKELEAWLPKDNWRNVNHLLVGFGQTICTPIRPKCNLCTNQNICPFVETNSK